MNLKLDAEGHVVVSDGKPVYVADGKDVPFDAPAAMSKITSLQGEAMGHRQGKEAAETKLKAFDGMDPDKARAALDTVGNLDAKRLVDAGEVQRVKDEVAKGFEGKLTEADARYADLQGKYHGEKIANAFAGSKFISDKVAAPIDMLQATFGRHFGVDDHGRVIAKDNAGNPIPSKTNFGDPASFEEAIEAVISAYPNKDHILKGTTGAGGGAGQGGAGGVGGKRTVTRAEFDKMDPVAKSTLSKESRAGKVDIID